MSLDHPKTLAVVRCGDASLHQSWSNRDERRFDLAISYFGASAGKPFPEADFRHYYKGGKWDGLHDFFRCHPETVERYDYFWFPDDDIEGSTGTVNRLFSLGAEHGLEVFQPALDSASYYSHLITLQHPSFVLRYTNFVEIMVPVLSRRLLQASLESFRDTRSGFGLDFVWPDMARNTRPDGRGAAILDAVTVRHTRPVGGALHKMIKATGERNTSDELRTAVQGFQGAKSATINGQPVPRIRVLSGVKRSGARRSGAPLAAAIGFDMLRRHLNTVQPVDRLAAIRHALKSAAPN